MSTTVVELRPCAGCGELLVVHKGQQRLKWCSDMCRKRTLYSGECEVCGAPTIGTSSGRDRAARFCAVHGREAAAETNRRRHLEHRVAIEAMWADGYTAREIGAEMGWSDATSGCRISILRRRGYDLPHRRTPEQLARILVGSDERLTKARAKARAARRVVAA